MRLTAHRLPGLILTDHEFDLPLDHTRPDGARLTLFAREVMAAGQEGRDLPWLVFLQGGPGYEAPRPLTSAGWLKRALREYRVLLLDQRGTGRSSPVNHQTLARLDTPQAQADYLKHFRADSIVWDAEAIRRELAGAETRWSVLGQSFGGFCVTTYLSLAPDGLREALITGGLPPIGQPVDEVYRATYRRVLARNQAYAARYPDDPARARDIADYLTAHDVRLPTSGRLSPRRFQQLGLAFGMSDGFEQVHYLIENAFVTGRAGRELSHAFLRAFENSQSFETNPIFALLHEPIYCEGTASRWAAERVRAEYPEFELRPDQPVCFTGEMIYPWMFDDYACLQPLKAAAEQLATYADWPRLYDPQVLRRGGVPLAAAIYYNDMYVEREFSEATARLIPGARLWVTSEYEHNGLRAEGEVVLGRLLDMLHGEA